MHCSLRPIGPEHDCEAACCHMISPMQAATLGSSPLAQKLLGSWTSAPKSARDDYEVYMKTVSSLLGGEASSEELQVCSVYNLSHAGLQSSQQKRHSKRLQNLSSHTINMYSAGNG